MSDQISLATSYMGLKLAHPFMMGASPLTGHLDNVRRLEDGGCAAIVMHSLFEEQIEASGTGRMPDIDWNLPVLANSLPHFPRPEKFPLPPDEYLEQVHRIKAALSIPVIGSLNGWANNGWLTYGPLIEQAGADGLELNVYYLATGLEDTPAEIERDIVGLVRSLKSRMRIPVAVKLTAFYTAFAGLAARLDAAGADGLILFNRFYQPDIDIETLEILPTLRLSTSGDLLLRLRWLAILSEHVKASLAATGGVHTVVDGVKALLVGAHAVQLVSAVLQQGPQHFRSMEQGLRYWMARHHYDSVDAVRGLSNLKRCTNPACFERANYMRVLREWSG